MNRSLAFALASLFVTACAGGAQPSASPERSEAPASAPATTTPSPSPLVTISPTPHVPPSPYVAGSTQPPTLETRAVASKDGIRVAVEAQRVPLEAGKPIDVTLTIENRGTATVNWMSDSCEIPGLAYVHLDGDAWIGGAPQSGIAAEFKAFALEVFGHAGYSPLFLGLRIPGLPENTGCADVGIGHAFEPGAKLERVLRWPGSDVVPIPEGPATIVGSFAFHAAEDEEWANRIEVEARLPTWIVSDEVVDYLPPGPAIDVALADQEFRTWLEAADTSGWINTSHTLDIEDGTWEIGLFRDGGPGFYASVTLDARTGEVLKHRFE